MIKKAIKRNSPFGKFSDAKFKRNSNFKRNKDNSQSNNTEKKINFSRDFSSTKKTSNSTGYFRKKYNNPNFDKSKTDNSFDTNEKPNFRNNFSRDRKNSNSNSSDTYKKEKKYSTSNRTNSRSKNFGRSRGNSKNKFTEANIHFSKFINKAVITERVEKFIPEHLFTDFNINEKLKINILSKGYNEPTPIQDKIIPHVLRGEDVVGIANTGTGKTAAFLIPLIQKVIVNPKEQILIVVPTRELAQQIESELISFVRNMKIYSVCCVGGAPIGKQIHALKFWNSFVIGTPGRLKDLIERRILDLTHFSTIVLDEADRMLDMGFIDDMKFIMAKMETQKHTLFFAATMSREIEKLIKEFLNNPVSISVKTRDTAKSVDQDVIKINGREKIDVLHEILRNPEFIKVIIFGKTKRGVEKLASSLSEKGFRVDSIHGDKSQGARQRALLRFKDDHIKILVATDVAARGLDIPDVSHVINYDLPSTYDDYIHRIGRTGRGSKTGNALTFIS